MDPVLDRIMDWTRDDHYRLLSETRADIADDERASMIRINFPMVCIGTKVQLAAGL